MSNITLNIIEPGSTPTEPVVPNTGLFTHGIGGPEATILGITAAVIILAVIVAVLYYRKKQGKFISLKHEKSNAIGLAVLALLVSIGTVAGLLKLGASAADDSLTVTTSSTDFTIELGDTPVFAALPVELTVAEATEAGYTLTAYTDNTDLVSTTDSSKVIPMVVADEGELTTLTDNTYGLALVEPEDKDSEVYTTLSTEADTPTLITDKDYKATEANDTTTIYYSFYITPDVPYGTYEGSNINYMANPNYITTLSFNGNGSDGGVDMEGMTLLAGDTITLPQNTFTKEGYSFTGWNTVATPTTEDPGIAYADKAQYTASTVATENVTLYAQWKEPLKMQDVATWGSTLSEGDTIEAVDSRDGKSYWVAKLADGNIWMTQNLDLDIEAGRTYTSADTDLANSTIGTSWTPSVSTSTTSSWTSSYTTPESYDPGDLYWNGALIYDQATCEEYGGTWQPWGSCSGANPTSSAGNIHYHIGNYYNWTAAVAMSDSSSYTTDQQDVNQSICPAGWRLPTYSDNKSYQNLVNTQGLTTGTSGNIQNSPVYFVYGGYWNGSSGDVGSYGYYWSSVVKSIYSAYQLNFNINGNLYPQDSGGCYYGYSLRCVAR